ncbi:MAG TPA: hypothetical protein VHX60_00495 [Acidobacteriaceae bacterium]|nr:hypothetical protein [Acidobacteriaceae bacterium]
MGPGTASAWAEADDPAAAKKEDSGTAAGHNLAGEIVALMLPLFGYLAFSVGSIDSYLNDPPAASPPTKRNSFEFTTGLTHAIRTKY